MPVLVPYLLLTFAAVYISFQLVLIIRLKYYYKPVAFKPSAHTPLVSILIAARNEEAHIIKCLNAIQQLHYPKDNIEVWIGDDQSSDRTSELVAAFIKNKPNHHLVSIQESVGNAKGKANVLAQLARKAGGEFLYITDADIEVPVHWIEGLMAGFEESTGIVSGSTLVKGDALLARIQRIDWAYACGMMHVVSEMNMPVTAVGNNMVIRKTCYESTGGYEELPFSVTEDLQLFLTALEKGWGFRNLMDPASTAVSAPLSSLKDVLKQRKRWISGAFRLPVLLTTFLAMQAMYFPVLVTALFLLPPVWVLAFWLTIFNLQTFFIETTARRMGIGSLRRNIILFELNRYIFPFLIFTYRLLPGVEWKGRKYSGKDIQP
ncbi:MAG: glycosyltransferase [Cytophagales bacterium]|nr:glycosyltransferase [Cytophaga sp.]